MSERSAAITALVMNTVSFVACFFCWVSNAVLITYLVNTGTYTFDEAQVGWLLAVPILTGALVWVPLGLLTDRYGGRGESPRLYDYDLEIAVDADQPPHRVKH
jgi:NNP family nitrate/nitrite transporter-like MFS transporter